MDPLMAEKCLRNIANLVRPGGYIFITGVDLNVRAKVADELGWHPVQELLEEIHEGDPSMQTFWPWHYGGLEPLNKKRRDWKRRYAAAFEVLPGDNRAGDGVNLDISPKVVATGEYAGVLRFPIKPKPRRLCERSETKSSPS
jgi:hypothetical protein